MNYIVGNRLTEKEDIIHIYIKKKDIESFENWGKEELKFNGNNEEMYRHRIFMKSGIVHDKIFISSPLSDIMIEKDNNTTK